MNFRSDRLRELASEAPKCMYCGEANRGQIVLCHLRSIKYGAGTGIKPHDLPIYLCNLCHDLTDGRIGSSVTTKEQKELVLYEGLYRSVLWLLESGYLVVK